MLKLFRRDAGLRHDLERVDFAGSIEDALSRGEWNEHRAAARDARNAGGREQADHFQTFHAEAANASTANDSHLVADFRADALGKTCVEQRRAAVIAAGLVRVWRQELTTREAVVANLGVVGGVDAQGHDLGMMVAEVKDRPSLHLRDDGLDARQAVELVFGIGSERFAGRPDHFQCGSA